MRKIKIINNDNIKLIMNKEQCLRMIKDIDSLLFENSRNMRNIENVKEIINERLSNI